MGGTARAGAGRRATLLVPARPSARRPTEDPTISRLDAGSFRWYRRARLWVAPTVGAVVALVIGTALLLVDGYLLTDDVRFVPTFQGEPDTARSLLQTVATSIATLTALVLTIVTVVLQLASGLYSHRAVRTLLHDLHSHVTLATFVGTFTYALLGLLGLETTLADTDDDLVVGLTVPFAFVLGVVSLGVFVSYIDHIVHRARGTTIIEHIGAETRDEIDRAYPARLDEPCPFPDAPLPGGDPQQTIPSPAPGVIIELDEDRLAAAARDRDVVLVFAPAVGDFVPQDAPLLHVFGGEVDADEVVSHVQIDPERTIAQDVAFGLRLLVDVAEHAVSPSTNDPTTAAQCIDQLHDLLRRVAVRHLQTGWSADGDDRPRVYVPPRTWDDLLELAWTEIRHYGASDLQVIERLRGALGDLLEVTEAPRDAAVRHQLDLLDETVEREFGTARR